MLKRISAISLISLMTFSSVGFAVTGGVTPHQLDVQKPTLSKTNLVATDKQNVDPAKEVRVIVELAGSAANGH
jgi:lactocepin